LGGWIGTRGYVHRANGDGHTTPTIRPPRLANYLENRGIKA
jgi:hypothetical protein